MTQRQVLMCAFSILLILNMLEKKKDGEEHLLCILYSAKFDFLKNLQYIHIVIMELNKD